MSEMIERVARAMFDDEIRGVPSEMAEASWRVPGHADRWRDRARAALKALREPTKAMKSAPDAINWAWRTEEDVLPEELADIWRQMIDAALETK